MTPKTITITSNTVAKDDPQNPKWKANVYKGETRKLLAIAPDQKFNHVKVTIEGTVEGRNTMWLYNRHIVLASIGETALEGSLKPGTFRINSIARKLIKEFEGVELRAYLDPIGIPTIGVGSTIGLDGTPVKIGASITELQAWQLFDRDGAKFMNAINSLVKVPLTGKQVAALLSFTYNVGDGALAASTLLKLINAGASHAAIAEQFMRWCKAGNQVLSGLERRRKAEVSLWEGRDR